MRITFAAPCFHNCRVRINHRNLLLIRDISNTLSVLLRLARFAVQRRLWSFRAFLFPFFDLSSQSLRFVNGRRRDENDMRLRTAMSDKCDEFGKIGLEEVEGDVLLLWRKDRVVCAWS